MKNTLIQTYVEKALTLKEAAVLVEHMEQNFIMEFNVFASRLQRTNTQYEKEEIKQQAQAFYEDYKRSLSTIETFVRDTCLFEAK